MLCFGLAVHSCFAQVYPIVKYTTREGLVQNQVLCLLKDSRGFVWCGTQGGLSRFNGETFENFTEKDGLLGSVITDIQEDTHGHIWLLATGKGLMRFDGEHFVVYPFATSNHVGNLMITQAGAVQMVCNNQLWQVVGDSLREVPLPNSPLHQIEGVAYHAASQSYLFAGTDTLYRYQQGKWQIVATHPNLSIQGVIQGEVHLSRTETDGSVTYLRWDGTTLRAFLTLHQNQFEVHSPLPYDYVFSTQDQLYWLKHHSSQVEQIAAKPSEFVNRNFHNQAPSAMLWLPTEKGLWGLVRTGFRNFTEQQVPYAWSMVEDRIGDYYFLNYGVSLQHFDGSNIHTIPATNYEPAMRKALKTVGKTSIPTLFYYKAIRDKLGAVWLPHAEGVFRHDGKAWDYLTVPSPAGGSSIAFCLAEDPQRKRVLVASQGKVYTIETTPPFRTAIITGSQALFSRFVLSVAVSPEGAYWFSGLGISCYNPATKQHKEYNQVNGKLLATSVHGLFFDQQGTLWAMSSKDGLHRFNPKRDCFERVLASAFPRAVLFMEQLDESHLLLADDLNVYVLNLKTYNQTGQVVLKCFNHHNGFMGLEPVRLGSYKDSKGQIWIASGSVLSVLDPHQLDLQTKPLRTFITKIQVGDSIIRVPFVGKNEQIKLPFGYNAVSFTLESVGEDKPFRSQFSYRLVGESEKWSSWQEQNLLMINDLTNGTHTLEVRSRTGTLEVATSSTVCLQFKVSNWFWRSPDFYQYASLVGLLLVAGMGFLWWREHRQTQTVLAQQKQIEEREREVRFLQIQTIQAQMNPHFTFNVLGTIQSLILKNNPEEANVHLLKLANLIRNYLEASVLYDDAHGSMFAHEIPLANELELLRMYVEFEQLQYEDRFGFELTVDGKLNPENYRLPPLLIQPFVENAVKHGLLYKETKGNLWIRFVGLGEETLVCTIEDDGVGREAAHRIQAASLRKYKSRGTGLVEKRKDLLNEMGYDIHITTDDRIGGGTVVTVQIGYK